MLTGDVEVMFTLSGLSVGTSYRLYLVLASTANDAFTAVADASFMTNPLPSFTGLLSAGSVTITTAGVSFTPSDASEYCWVLLPEPVANKPTVDHVLRGEDGDGTLATFRSPSGGVMLTGDFEVTFTLSALSANTSYRLFMVLAGTAGDAFSDVAEVQFMTESIPIPPPSFTKELSAGSVTVTTAEISFTPSDASAYCWVLLSGSVANKPTADHVRYGQDGDGMPAAIRSMISGGVPLSGNADVMFTLSSLSGDTSYSLFLILANAAGDDFSSIAEVSFTTEPAPPSFTQTPSVGSITTTSAEVSFTPNAAGRYYWVLLSPTNRGVTTVDQVRMGQDGDGNEVPIRSAPGGVVLTGDAAVTFSLSDLEDGNKLPFVRSPCERCW